jgi:thiamine biosynthesis lipoprotein
MPHAFYGMKAALHFVDRPVRRTACWFAFAATLLCCACFAADTNSSLERYEFERPEMGMSFRIVMYALAQTNAQAASEAAFERIKQLNDIMSDYDEESELSKLSRLSGTGRAIPVSPDLWFVLSRAQDLAERSGGAFDVTVGPLVNLWRRARRQHKLPDPDRLMQARQAVGYQHVRLDPKAHTVELLVPSMKLDLGGIAKGYAIGEALKTLRAQRIERALVEGGGDVAVSNPPPGKKGWRFELSSLDVTNAPAVRFLSLKNVAISTSGDLYQRMEIDGKRYSHIVDPHTGIGLTDHSLVNVIAPESITADSLTKVVSVLGPQKGLRFIEQTPEVAARIMRDPDGKIETFESSRFSQYYERN